MGPGISWKSADSALIGAAISLGATSWMFNARGGFAGTGATVTERFWFVNVACCGEASRAFWRGVLQFVARSVVRLSCAGLPPRAQALRERRRWAGVWFSGVRPSESGLDGRDSLGVRLTSDRGIDGLAASCAFVYGTPMPEDDGATACRTRPRPPPRSSTLAGGKQWCKEGFGIDQGIRPASMPRPAPTTGRPGQARTLDPACRRSLLLFDEARRLRRRALTRSHHLRRPSGEAWGPNTCRPSVVKRLFKPRGADGVQHRRRPEERRQLGTAFAPHAAVSVYSASGCGHITQPRWPVGAKTLL